MYPSEEELKQWKEIALRRKAILPYQFNVLETKEVLLECGKCRTRFTRPMIVAENDPVFVCPSCKERNYVPIDWNVVRKPRRRY